MTTTTTTTNTIPQVCNFFKEASIPYTPFTLTIRNGKKIPNNYKTHQKFPKKLKNIQWTLWNAKECREVTKFLQANASNLDAINVLPYQGNYVCLDFDSKEELERFYEREPKMREAHHTLSCGKNKLPHHYVKVVGKMPCSLKGKDLPKYGKKPREFDIITENAFENPYGEVKGIFTPELTAEEIWKYMGIPLESLNYDVTYQEKRDGIKAKRILKKSKVVKVGKTRTKVTNTTKVTNVKDGKYSYTGELNGKYNKNKGIEKIPFDILEKLVMALDPSKFSYMDWFRLYCGVAYQVPQGADIYKFLTLLNKFSDKTGKADYTMNEKTFTKVYLDADNVPKDKKVGSSTLWWWLYEHDRDLWKTLAFNPYRSIKPREFQKLNLEEALNAFNSNHSFVKGELVPEIIEWDEAIKQFKNMTEGVLEKNYSNLKYKHEIFYTDKEEATLMKFKSQIDSGDTNKIPSYKLEKIKADIVKWEEAEVKDYKKVKGYELKLGIVKEWLEWTDRSQFERDGFYPKTEVPYDTHNQFIGFDIEKVEDYEEKISGMSKEELEKELEFILTHIKNIVGKEKKEELYEIMLKYISHMFKYPSVLPRVGWFIHSKEGTGKNQLLNLLMNMTGEQYSVSTAKGEQLFGRFNALLNHKIIVNLNEIHNLPTYIEDIKTCVTDKKISTEKKNKEVKAQDNYTRMFFYGNNPNAMIIGFNDRRWIVCEAEYKHTKVEGYMEELARQVDSVWIQKCLYRYLMEFVEVDSRYNFEKNRPKTTSYHELRKRNIPWFHRFIKYLWEKKGKELGTKKWSKTKLWSMYQEFVVENCEKLSIKRDSFDSDLNRHSINNEDENETCEEFLENHEDKIFQRFKTDRWWYQLDIGRLENFVKVYEYDWYGPLFLPSESECETDGESDDE